MSARLVLLIAVVVVAALAAGLAPALERPAAPRPLGPPVRAVVPTATPEPPHAGRATPTRTPRTRPATPVAGARPLPAPEAPAAGDEDEVERFEADDDGDED